MPPTPRNHVRAADGVGVGALRREAPCVLDELRMVDVEMVVDVVVVRANELVGDGVPPARHVRYQDVRLDLLPEEPAHPFAELRLEVGEEQREGAILSRVLPCVCGELLGYVRIQRRRLGPALREPFGPLRAQSRLALHEGVAVVAEVALVNQREERERRLVGPAAPGLRVDVPEKRAGERKVVGVSAFVEENKFLVVVHRDLPVAVYADGAPRHCAGDEEVRREVYPVRDACVEQVVEHRHAVRTYRRAVLMVA